MPQHHHPPAHSQKARAEAAEAELEKRTADLHSRELALAKAQGERESQAEAAREREAEWERRLRAEAEARAEAETALAECRRARCAEAFSAPPGLAAFPIMHGTRSSLLPVLLAQVSHNKQRADSLLVPSHPC